MILGKVRRTIDEYGMLEKGDRVVVAVSGGPDSTALLSILFSLREERGISLHIAHLNHMFRGREAEKDVLYVKKLARKFGLPLMAGKRNVPALIGKRKLSPEEGARQARYEFLQKVAGKVKANKIAIGSTADDQAETVLMRLLRGSGLKGLTGMAPIRPLGCSELSPSPERAGSGIKPLTLNLKLDVIRPLLEVCRPEIEDYLKGIGLRPRRDSSNRDPVYLRNRIRQELLPGLANDYNPRIKSILSGLARVLRADEDYLARITGRIFPRVAKVERGGRVLIDIKRLQRLHLSIRRRILRKGIESVKGNLRGISLTQMDDILRIIDNPGSLEVHLPQGVVTRHSYGNLIISVKRPEKKRKRAPGRRLPLKGVPLRVPGETVIEELDLIVQCFLLPRGKVQLPGRGSLPEKSTAYFDFHKVKPPLFIRHRREGDVFRPLAMKGRKKLKDFFIDRKVPREARDEIPLLVQGEKILWIIGYRQGEEAKVTGKTKKVLRVKISSGKG